MKAIIMILVGVLEVFFDIISLIIPIALPFLVLYFTYRLIKGLMKYHHDLKQEDKEK